MESILRSHLGAEWDVRTLADYDDFAEPEEVGATYVENAKIKAEASARATGEMCIADDAGLEIAALGGAPGVHSKRFEGEWLSFPDKIRIILQRMQSKHGAERAARFRCAIAIASPRGETKVFESTKGGFIAEAASGAGGFGYDSIFFLPELGKTFAELPADEKNRISHRGIVLADAAEWLRHHYLPKQS